MSKVIIVVDLNCRLCSREIKKIVCEIQGPCGIKAIAYDDDKNTVTLSGSFDADRLKKRIAYLAKKHVKISFKEEEKKAEKKEEKKEEKKKEEKKEEEKKEEKKEEKGKEGSKPAEAEPVKGEVVASTVMANPYMFGGPAAAGQVCCYRPMLESTYGGGVRCLNCGRVVGLEQPWAYGTPSYVAGPYAAVPYVAGPSFAAGPSYGGGPYYGSTYDKPGSNYFSEEDPSSCTVM